jgi:peptidoglycan/xylan/chitin deacetylase (PgdA/CDA1 family)
MNVLMYHSISGAPGPTNISPETFRGQMETLADCGYRTASLGTFKAWHDNAAEDSAKTVVITFDDGFLDFAESAVPILKSNGFTATVFVPSGRMGGTDGWETSGNRRPLMSWAGARDLTREKIDFGGHSVTHTDLTRLSAEELSHEVRQCREEIEDELGCTPTGFAPPYGRAGQREREEIRKWFQLSFGTVLGRAGRDCDPYNVPRIDMHYFRELNRWHDYLKGRGELYFAARRFMRGVRERVTG